MTANPVWFGPSERPLFGWLHVPTDGRARTGVVVCPPFGQEYLKAHYALRRLARQLEDRGFLVLRFDYDGTGDSAGSGADPGRVEAWLSSVRAAIEYVRKEGVHETALVGMRIGATLAAVAAERDGEIDELVLWDPCSSGRSFLREQGVLLSVSLGIKSEREDGSFETPGDVYTAETVSDLRGLSIAALRGRLAGTVLMLTRPNRARDSTLVKRLSQEAVRWGVAAGQEDLIEAESPHRLVPETTIMEIARWLSEVAGSDRVEVQAPNPARPATVSAGSFQHDVVEQPVWLGPLGLFGIIAQTPEKSAGPTLIFLSVAQEHHVGPDRLWVDLSRKWAALGWRTLRVDLSGLGDSPVRSGQTEFVARPKDHFDDVVDVSQAVSPTDPSDVILIGLCSGAYQALDSALGLGPRGVVAINPLLTIRAPELASGDALDPRRRVALPRSTVVQAFHNDGPLAPIRRRFPSLGWRVRILMAPSRRPSRWLRELTDAGVDVLLVCGDREARPFQHGTSSRTLAKLTASGHFRFEYIPGLEHSLLVESHRNLVSAMLTEHLSHHFGIRQPSTPK